LWQDSASKIEEAVLSTKPVIAIKGVSVKEYNGSRTCGTLQQSMIDVVSSEAEIGKDIFSWWTNNPNISDFHNLSASSSLSAQTPSAADQSKGGRNQTLTSIADMREECKRGFFGDKGTYFDRRANVPLPLCK
jgi:replication factor A1